MEITLAEALDLLDDVSAALKNVMAQFGNQMRPADRSSRDDLVERARAVCDTHLRANENDDA